MSNRPTWAELAALYANAALKAEVRYREKKQLFDDYTAAYQDRVANAADSIALINAATKAGTDGRRSDAAKAADWFRSEAIMYAQLSQMAWLYREE